MCCQCHRLQYQPGGEATGRLPVRQAGFHPFFQVDYDTAKELTEQVLALIQVDDVPPAEIIVLARLYAQLDNLEAEFLSRQIPYRVDGQEPFFKRQEINTLLDYIRLAQSYHKPLTDDLQAIGF